MTFRDWKKEPLDTASDVETPEHVRFRYRLAGPSLRALAYLIDAVVRYAIAFVIVLLATASGLAGGDDVTHASLGIVLVVLFALEWGYYVLWETLWSGRSPGKRAVRIRVVSQGGHPLRFMDSVLRNLLRAADFLPIGYPLGLVVMARDPWFRRLGDLVAGTMVVLEERRTVGGVLTVQPPPTPSELEPLPARVPLSGDDVDAIELYLRRIGRLTPAREKELAEIVAPIYAARLGLRVREPERLLALLYSRARGKGAA